MNTAADDILAFVAEAAGRHQQLVDDANIFDTLGIDGDDAIEFMEHFANTFGVDMTGYLWYFHHGEEGLNFGALVFKPPYLRVPRVPITPATLAEAARIKRWPLSYPAHQLPARRWDLILTFPVMAAILLLAAVAGTLIK